MANSVEAAISREHGAPDVPLTSIPFHISCKACHHLHRAKCIRLPTAEGIHERCSCDVCGGLLFGVGRYSTQTSLASELTRRSLRSSASLKVCTDDAPGISSSARFVSESRDRLISAFRTPLLRGSLLRPDPPSQRTQADQPDIPVEEENVGGTIPEITGHFRNRSPLRPIRRTAIKDSAKRWIRTLFKRRSPNQQQDLGGDAISPQRIPSKSTQILGKQIGGTPSSPQCHSPTPDAASEPQKPSHQDTSGLVVSTPDSTTTAEGLGSQFVMKEERIHRIRLQLTKDKHLAKETSCRCSDHCPCAKEMRKAVSLKQTNLDLLSQVPHHSLGHLLHDSPRTSSSLSHGPAEPMNTSRQVAYAGTHLRLDSIPSQDLLSENLYTGRPIRSSISLSPTLHSQAMTAVTSTSSGTRSRHEPIRRTNSLPAGQLLDLHAYTDGLRFGTLEASPSFHQLSRLNSTEESFGSRQTEQTWNSSSSTEFSVGEDVNNPSSTALTTGIADGLPTSSDAAGQPGAFGSGDNPDGPQAQGRDEGTISPSTPRTAIRLDGSDATTPVRDNGDVLPASSTPSTPELSNAIQELADINRRQE